MSVDTIDCVTCGHLVAGSKCGLRAYHLSKRDAQKMGYCLAYPNVVESRCPRKISEWALNRCLRPEPCRFLGAEGRCKRVPYNTTENKKTGAIKHYYREIEEIGECPIRKSSEEMNEHTR